MRVFISKYVPLITQKENAMNLSAINWLAVLVCGIASLVVGFIWYSKPVFLKPWLKGIGKTEEFTKNPKPLNFVYLFIGSFIEAFFLALLIAVMGSMTLVSGLQAGFLVWLGFVATTSFADNLMSGGSFSLFSIQAGFHLVVLLVMGMILAVWH
jgi:hypothetical protein